MTDEMIFDTAIQVLENYEYTETAEALRAIRARFLTPVPPGSVPARIAVAVGTDSDGDPMRSAEVIHSRETDNGALKDSRYQMSHVTHEAIVTAHIPPRVVPTVQGQVEPCQFNPEEPIR